MMKYISTRGKAPPQNFEQVLLAGLAPDGGLYVPEKLPSLDFSKSAPPPLPSPRRGEGWEGGYAEIAESVMWPFVEGCIAREDFRAMIRETYNEKCFAHPAIAPLKKLYENIYVLELFHGPTLAFKDLALQLLGRLFNHVLEKRGENITIIGATSGDTGSAAIEGCYRSPRVNMFILHPHGKVSEVQRRQMTTVKADNVHNIAIEGNFDDCQALVKSLFADEELRRQKNLSAVNSINWARIMAQIVYYVSAALQLDEPASFIVPTGNFGNVLAGHYARGMGLEMDSLTIATNRNDILTRFFETGKMEAQKVEPTISPSMDIQISSNFERYLFELLDRDAEKLSALLEGFKTKGHFALDESLMKKARQDFTAARASEDETLATIKHVYEDTGVTLDPHTAVGVKAALERKGEGPVIALATAHPAKFPDAVERATGARPTLPERLSDLFEKQEFFTILPGDFGKIRGFISRPYAP